MGFVFTNCKLERGVCKGPRQSIFISVRLRCSYSVLEMENVMSGEQVIEALPDKIAGQT